MVLLYDTSDKPYTLFTRRASWIQNEVGTADTQETTVTTVNTWSENLDDFPPITQSVVDLGEWRSEHSTDKVQKGYSYFTERYIHDVEAKQHGCKLYYLVIAHSVIGVWINIYQLKHCQNFERVGI